ncbi:MAG: hypothetical protein J7641_01365 [Cyanobacteria bacterium SID2]|nr:hypothetical protein [Cyanobacteria bacterium SID2]MBP0005759.1 hypothetical protein [Cyanobacteria bacterium SBC]
MISNQALKVAKKAGAGLLLFIGVPIVLVSSFSLFDANPGVRELALIVLAFVGLPPTAIAGWLLWGLRVQNQQERLDLEQAEHDRLQTTFFRMLADNHGAITPLQFSIATQLPGNTAREYLDLRAKEFEATFEVSSEGTTIYRFELDPKLLERKIDELSERV